MVRQFLEQYYQLCGSDDREPLVRTCHPDAMFSLEQYYYQLCGSDDREPLVRAYHGDAMFSLEEFNLHTVRTR
jgi:hypothetical protein